MKNPGKISVLWIRVVEVEKSRWFWKHQDTDGWMGGTGEGGGVRKGDS